MVDVTVGLQSHSFLARAPSFGAKVIMKSESVPETISAEKAFYFYNEIGRYAGKNAASLKDFGEKVMEVDEKSLRFHLQRGDFEKWIGGVLKDEELARQVRELRETFVTSDNPRDRLHSIVSKRLEKLSSAHQVQEISRPKIPIGRKRDYPRR